MNQRAQVSQCHYCNLLRLNKTIVFIRVHCFKDFRALGKLIINRDQMLKRPFVSASYKLEGFSKVIELFFSIQKGLD